MSGEVLIPSKNTNNQEMSIWQELMSTDICWRTMVAELENDMKEIRYSNQGAACTLIHPKAVGYEREYILNNKCYYLFSGLAYKAQIVECRVFGTALW